MRWGSAKSALINFFFKNGVSQAVMKPWGVEV